MIEAAELALIIEGVDLPDLDQLREWLVAAMKFVELVVAVIGRDRPHRAHA